MYHLFILGDFVTALLFNYSKWIRSYIELFNEKRKVRTFCLPYYLKIFKHNKLLCIYNIKV